MGVGDSIRTSQASGPLDWISHLCGSCMARRGRAAWEMVSPCHVKGSIGRDSDDLPLLAPGGYQHQVRLQNLHLVVQVSGEGLKTE